MKIGIIGAGFTGLAAANLLLKEHQVTIFEKNAIPGGLAIGFNPIDQKTKKPVWDWPLEEHYHHWFTNDESILNLAKDIAYPVIVKRPKTSVFVDNAIYQLDSPKNVLLFPRLSLWERLRMAFALGIIRYNPFWQPLEKVKVTSFLPKVMGQTAYKKIWEPQLKNKFGDYKDNISLAWFWARLAKRTSSLAYPEGGFLNFAQSIVSHIRQQQGTILFETDVLEIKNIQNQVKITYNKNNKKQTEIFDKVLVTSPSHVFVKMAKTLPQEYTKKLLSLQGLGAINLVLRLKKPFFPDNTYWLSVCDQSSPIMAIVEHTNYMDKKHYNNEHLVYIGNYVSPDHPYMKMSANELLKIYTPYLKKINPNFHLSSIISHLFKASFAQPIIPTDYSKMIPPIQTPLPHVYLANMQQVYPWDRGTNYAVELGEKAAKLIDQQI